MSPRPSKSGTRSSRLTGRTGGKKSRGSARSRSLSVKEGAASSTRRALSARHGSRKSREISTRAKSGRRADSHASYAVKLLMQDHRAVERALAEFESAESEEKQAIARRICKMLTVHTQIEEELLYPAARDVLDRDDMHLVAEASVEHASVKDLIRQIESREQMDEPYEARVSVLGEYVSHHVGEEEREIFPRLERSSLDLDALGERLAERKKELTGEEPEGPHDGQGMPEEEGALEAGMAGARPHAALRGRRSTGLHARRH